MKQFKLCTIGILALSLFFIQCKKNQSLGSNVNTGNQVTTTICGLVLDENGLPIENAFVQCNGKNTMTTDKGIFILNQVSAFENKTDIDITKSGYFKSYKTILVKNGQQQFIKTILLKKDNSQYFDASSGGNVSFGNQLSFSFPANALVYKNTGSPYSGQAEMLVKFIDPTTDQGLMSMPGNLMGLDTNQNQKVLASYGMFVAEIYDQAGNLLQIKANEQVQMSMEIPAVMQSSASQTIPLWYFDEAKAIWIEEGIATLSGNKYVGQVSHFSFWNCDAPKDWIKLEMTLVNQNNFPLSGVRVHLTNLSTNSIGEGITDAKGWVAGLVPDNTNIKMEIFAPNICGQIPIYTSTFTTGSTAKNLGIVLVNFTGANTCQISGKLVNCNQTAVSNGMVYIKELQELVFANQTGNFSYSMPCTPSSAIILFCHDLSNNQYDSISVNLIPGTNNVGNLNTCGLSGKFFNVTVRKINTLDSFSYSFKGNKDFLMCSRANNIPITLFEGANYGPMLVQRAIFIRVDQIIALGQYDVLPDSNFVTVFESPENIFGENFKDKDHTGKITITSNSPYPGDVTGYYEIMMKGFTSNQDYLVYGDFRLPKLTEF